MAIDTKNKRASSINMTGRALPDPDGTIDSGDRAHSAGVYRGFEDGGAPAPSLFRIQRVGMLGLGKLGRQRGSS